MSKRLLSFILFTVTSLQVFGEYKDPTQPAYPVKSEDKALDIEEEPRLSAIWLSLKSKRATINGIQVRQGQSIPGNIKIISIRRNTVIINQNGAVKTLQLLQRPYKNSQYKGHVLND